MPRQLRRTAASLARFSLRSRLTLLAAGAAAVVLTITALFLYDGLFSAIDDAVTAELRIRAQDVAAEIEAGTDPTMAGALVTQVLTPDGEVLVPAGAEPLLGRSDLPADQSEIVMDRPVVSIGDAARVLLRRVPATDGSERVVVVAGSTRPIEQARERLVLVLGIAGPAMVLAVAGMAWLLTSAALRPVARMTHRAATLSLQEPDSRLPQPPGDDEIAALGRTLNAMLARIESTVAHERAFVDDASHELRTPLAVLRSELELARLEIAEGADRATTTAALDSALEETDRLISLANRLLVLARADAGQLVGEPQPVALAALVERLVTHASTGAPSIEVDIGDATVWGDPSAIEQILGNLLSNASRWARTKVRLDASSHAGQTTIRVADDGPGFDDQLLEHAFDRFSRAGAARASDTGGAGLGLAIVATSTAALGGHVFAGNGPPLGGACVTIVLPSARTGD
ncbi:MAG: sensor histidine kinase [Actinomycetota bacterium]